MCAGALATGRSTTCCLRSFPLSVASGCGQRFGATTHASTLMRLTKLRIRQIHASYKACKIPVAIRMKTTTPSATL